MIIKKLEVGPIMANCFIVGCPNTKEAAVIDPGDEPDRILAELKSSELKLKYIINTHGHFDHVGGNRRVKEATGAKIAIHHYDEPCLSQVARAAFEFGLSCENSPSGDILLRHGDKIEFGDITFEVIHVPGHSAGGICLYTEGSLFAGDTLFAGSIGRTDMAGGDYKILISGIKGKLLCLDEDTVVYTGHGPETTIGKEKRINPFLL